MYVIMFSQSAKYVSVNIWTLSSAPIMQMFLCDGFNVI